MPLELFFVISLALLFDFLNGVHDSSNIVATMIASRAFRPGTALGLTAVANFLGPFLFGVAVATTIGDEVAQSNALSIVVIIACLVGAIVWNVLTWILGIPSSSSHALIGGMVGAVLAGAGFGAIKLRGLEKVIIALFASPLLGFFFGFLLTRLIHFLVQNAPMEINNFFKRGQLVTALAMAFSHGTNDAQKTMGIITLGLVVLGYQDRFSVPFWVILVNAAAIALGTAAGGWRVIRTLGGRFYRIRPVHSFASQLSSSLVILGASLLGGPVSTTQVVSSSILGVGAAHRRSQVRWSVLGEILTAWLLTVPVCVILGWVIVLVLKSAGI